MFEFISFAKFSFLLVEALRDIFPKTVTWTKTSSVEVEALKVKSILKKKEKKFTGHRSHRRDLVDGPDENFKVAGLKIEISKCIHVENSVEVHIVIKNIKKYVCNFPVNVAERHSKVNTA